MYQCLLHKAQVKLLPYFSYNFVHAKTLDYGTGGYTDKLEEMVSKTLRGLRLRFLNGLEGNTCTRFFTSGFFYKDTHLVA